MATKHAKTLDDATFAKVLTKVAAGQHGLRDQVMVLLSYKAGLRAQEIAGLDWTDVCDSEGVVRSDFFLVPSDIAKGSKERTIPMHPHLHIVLTMLRAQRPKDTGITYGTIGRFKRLSSVSVRVWFHRLYETMKLDGCSSHSGRRTFITRLARSANLHGCSLVDVRLLAGHASIQTTENYIEPSPNSIRLVAAL